MLTVKKLRYSQFLSLEVEWNQLLQSSNNNNIFLTWQWTKLWIEAFNQNNNLCILEIRDNSSLIGIAPFYYKVARIPIKFKILKLCSTDDLSPDYMDFIVKKGEERKVAGAVSKYLIEKDSSWAVIDFNNVLRESIVSKEFKDYYSNNNVFEKNKDIICPYLQISGNYEDYLINKFKRKKRYNLKRQKKILLESKNLEYKSICEMSENISFIDKLFELHLKRASEKNIKSDFIKQKQKKFHRICCETLSKIGIIRTYYLGDKKSPVAVMYCYLYDNKLYYYQSGIDPSWSKYSVGTVLLSLVIEECFKTGIKEFDFLKGSEDYKMAWSSGMRTEHSLHIFNNTTKGTICRLYDKFKKFAIENKKLLKLR